MFTETEGSRKTIGDVDVLFHEGVYHLFHLVLPNHDFIAHAVSSNGFSWQRVENALFIGDPGTWDDLMLWTMHVTPDPHRPGGWRMFYTGLSRREQGRIQRVGLAVSDDLFAWRKAPVNWRVARVDRSPTDHPREASNQHAPIDPESCFPLRASNEHYESSADTERNWVSFRDPFFFRDNGEGWLLVAGRVKQGPLVRRGCVSILQETRPNHFESRPALHHPGLYDDIEVPNMVRLEDEYYLIGSIREDAKIRYWHTGKPGQPWRSYHDNVLMAAGNYAGRICHDDRGCLFWNFFSMDVSDRLVQNVMPPPKRLVRNRDGLLRVTSFEGFEKFLAERVDTRRIRRLVRGTLDDTTSSTTDPGQLELRSDAGYQAFVFEEDLSSFRLQATLSLIGLGKCGLVIRVDPQTHDGYYLSLDLLKGVAQLRSWKTGSEGTGEHMMQFRTLQSGFWHSETPLQARIQLIAFGSYLEFSVNGRVILSLADSFFESGLCGVYLETAHLKLGDLTLHRMKPLDQSEDYLVTG